MININSENDLNNVIICEGNGCHSTARVKVIVRVGSEGKVTFFLCERCKPKFCADDNNCISLDEGDES